uniref:Uncharacterized protein n=1 Tax=Oryza brachyantha TaxID=4533 RepID=J3MLY5_ORYBR
MHYARRSPLFGFFSPIFDLVSVSECIQCCVSFMSSSSFQLNTLSRVLPVFVCARSGCEPGHELTCLTQRERVCKR